MYNILTGGCNTKHPCNFQMSRPHGLPTYVLLLIHTSGTFNINQKCYDVSPNQALIIRPNTPYFYGNPSGEYIDDWLHFTVEDTSHFEEAFPFINVPFSISNIDSCEIIFRQLIWEHSYGDANYHTQNIDSLFSVLLNYLKTGKSFTTTQITALYQTQLQLLRLEIKDTIDENHSIQKCAQKLGISESYFQHLYSDCFNISFQQDLINMRIERAKHFLINSDMSMTQIAQMCGYNNEVHFYRQFKKITNLTPTKYKKSL